MDAAAPLTRFATPEDLVQQLKILPPAPKVILKLQQMARSHSSSVDDLVALIKVERALAARILRVANSAAYNLGEHCDSIEQAVQRIGFKEVHHLAVIVAGCEALNRPLPSYRIDTPALWHQTVACAVAAEHLARLCGEDEQAAYTAGLMQSVGMVVINAWVQTVAPGTALTYHDAATEWSADERHWLGYDQADAGGALLKAWRFPTPIAEAVRCQYDPQCSAEHPRQAAILSAARWLRSVVCNFSPEIIPAPEPATLALLGLEIDQLKGSVPVVLRHLDRAREALGAA
jgi:HD-like signal output (HDOD) protein